MQCKYWRINYKALHSHHSEYQDFRKEMQSKFYEKSWALPTERRRTEFVHDSHFPTVRREKQREKKRSAEMAKAKHFIKRPSLGARWSQDIWLVKDVHKISMGNGMTWRTHEDECMCEKCFISPKCQKFDCDSCWSFCSFPAFLEHPTENNFVDFHEPFPTEIVCCCSFIWTFFRPSSTFAGYFHRRLIFITSRHAMSHHATLHYTHYTRHQGVVSEKLAHMFARMPAKQN